MFSWETIADGKNHVWSRRRDEPSPRNLKRVRYSDGSLSKPATEGEGDDDDGGFKKRKKMDSASSLGPSTIKACNTTNDNPDGHNPFAEWISGRMPEGEAMLTDEQKTLHRSMRVEMARLCQVLKFSDADIDLVMRFLEYVIKNRDVNSRSQSVVQALQISLCWIAASITKTKIDKKDSLMLAKQLLNYQCTEEQAHSVYLILKDMYSQCPEKIVDSVRYCSLAEEGGTPIEKPAASDADNRIMKLKKKSKKRMKRLVQKYEEQIQEFLKIWEEERVKLMMDHNVESAFIRSVHSQSLVGMDKVKILNNDLDAKTSELNLQKSEELKKLKARRSADIGEEERRTAQLLAEAKAYSSKPETSNGLESLGPQPQEHVFEGPQPIETHVENSVTVSSQSEPGVLSLSMTENVNKLKDCSSDDEAILENQPGSVELVPDEVERTASEKVSDKGCKSASPDEVVSSGDLQSPKQTSLHCEQTSDRCDLSPHKGLDELVVEKPRILQTEAEAIDALCPVPSNHEEPVTNETVMAGLSNNEAQGTGANVTPVLSNNGILVTDKTATLVQLSNEAPVTDKTITYVPSNREVPLTENSGLLRCNTSPATEENDQGISSPQTAKPRGTEVMSHESTPRSRENLDVHINHPNNTEFVNSAAQGQSAELSAPSQNDVAIQSQAVTITAERPNQAVLQPGIDPSRLPFLSHQPTSGSLYPSLSADPLKNELDNLHREAEQLENNQKNLISQLSTDCDKEIRETIDQIRKKYVLKFQEGDAGYQLKKQELDKNQKKVHMNKILAAVFRSTFSDPGLAGVPAMQQVTPSSFVQHTHHPSMLPSVGVGPPQGLSLSQPPPSRPITAPPQGPSLSQPPPSRPITAPSLLSMQQHLSRAHPVTRSPTPIHQNIPTVRSPTFLNQNTAAFRSPTTNNRNVPPPPLQAVQNMAALFSSTPHPLRPPPLIGTINPSCNPRPAGEIRPPPLIGTISPSCNPRVGGEIRSAAPHLQSFRPPAATSAPAPHLRAPHRLPYQALTLPVLTNLLVSQNRAAVPPQAPPPNNRPSVPATVEGSATENRLPSTFGSLESSGFETVGTNVPGNVVCLLDDD